MARTRRLLGIMAVAAVPLAACASQDADAQDVAETLTEAGATQDQADCVADAFEADLTQDELNDVADANDLDDLPEALRNQVQEILDGCFAEDGEAPTEGDGGSDDTTDSTEPTDSTESTEDTTTTTAG